ncbi:MAG TPA: tetratricopeptide repeat protein [Gemmataceae bacterium]|nr:tetratricopeptide repeat protein [Gemmataceae bacterium]
MGGLSSRLPRTFRGRLFVVLVVVGLVLVTFTGWSCLRPVLALNEVEQALARNDPAKACELLNRFSNRWPDNEKALLVWAQALRRTDDCSQAEWFLTEYERRAGKTPASELEWSLLGVQQGDFAGQEESLRAIVDRNSSDAANILEALAKGYNVAFRYTDALAALGRLIESHPDHVPALILRGTILDHQRQADAAEKSLRRAVELAPASAEVNAALATVLNHHGRTREAIQYFERALQSNSFDSALLVELARAHVDDDDLPSAERRLDELLAINPEHAVGLVERGRIDIRRGQFDRAEPFLARAVVVAPWKREAHHLRLMVLRRLGKNEASAACAARIADLQNEDGLGGKLRIRARDSSRDVATRWELWLWSQRNGQIDEGIAWLTEILRADPKDPQVHAAFADYFERAGQPRRAALHRDATSTAPGASND